MLTYHEYEKTVFDWLMAKHEDNPNFTFTVRQSAGQGSETDYFIGTAKSNYFATTFWTLPVSYPGSSSDCINLILQLSKTGYSYYFEFNQTQTPHDSQNQSALNLVKQLKGPLENKFAFKRPLQETNKIYTIQIAAPEKIYGNIDFMLADIDKQLNDIIELTDVEIEREKKRNPQFKAHRVTQDEFDSLIQKLNRRIEKHDNTLNSLLQNLGDQVTQTYFTMLRRLLNDLLLEKDSEKIYFNYERDKLIFGIGQRYVFNVEVDGSFRMISKNKISGSESVEFKSNPTAFLTSFPSNYDPNEHYSDFLLGAREILEVTEKSGFFKFDKRDFRTMAFEIDKRIENDCLIELIFEYPKNQILYGPPGTGKTYCTINKALEIINDKEVKKLNWLDRKAVKQLYQKKVDEGQIVFTTFHQSMSYEDFVEGIKPDIEEDKEGVRSVVYDIKDGIFKDLCNKARASQTDDHSNETYHFDDAWNELLSLVQNYQENEKDYILDILTPKKGFKINEITNNGNLRLQPINAGGAALEYTVSYLRLKELQKAIPDLSRIKNIDKEFRAVIGGMNSTAYWATLNFINNWLVKANLKNQQKKSPMKPVPHVLIIDEINRGNVSAIFGELITLIEESKRLGNGEALEVTLPYSKDKFGVPDNVYILGTMNTADRSVESLDTALRRRFSFEEMLPNPDLISPEKMVFDLWSKHAAAGWDDEAWLTDEKNLYSLLGSETLLQMSLEEKQEISKKLDNREVDEIVFKEFFNNDSLNLKIVLEKINIRLEKLLSRDHTIGHSFFLGVTTKNDLYDSFFNKIIPLLQEYFFGDYGKMGLVLGSGFVRELKQSDPNLFTDFPYEDKEILLEKKIYRINKFDDKDGFIVAVKGI